MTKKTATAKASSQPLETEASERHRYLALGRTNQKMRTRDALVEVAAELVRAGLPVSVSEVAQAARVSNTTAYRYFPNSEMLAFQATVAAANTIEAHELIRAMHRLDTAEKRVDAIITGSHAMTMEHQSAFRSLVRHTIEDDAAKLSDTHGRPTFRRGWIEDALAPVKKQLGKRRFAKLTGALCMFVGIEPVVVLGDICQMAPDDALEAKRWAAQLLLAAALEEAAAKQS